MRSKQQWEVSAYCPECRQSFPMLISTDNAQLDLYKDYLTKMLMDGRPVSKCEKCGANHEGFVIKPIYTKRSS
ncbi:hypothetical protein [Desulfosporosinus sp. BG]|uniref:hypothetical protein n=1 Tax=Desulfosporosinus sp. BG TaxID=1633135 RepID=UPI0008582477|nr:hypothetical protein [Desulfosporosinus sp. BG]ODA40371.1 hypothetical protein DSBG_2793 [Desulfosporosinus sp. BG]